MSSTSADGLLVTQLQNDRHQEHSGASSPSLLLVLLYLGS